MWELDHKEAWALKKWCFWNVVLEKTLESRLDSKIKPVNPKGNQPWILTGSTDAEAEYFGHLIQKANSLEKTLMLGKIEDRRRRGQQRMSWLDGIINAMYMSLSRLGDSEGQGSLACFSPWGCKELDTTEWLNNKNFVVAKLAAREKNLLWSQPLTQSPFLQQVHQWDRVAGLISFALCTSALQNPELLELQKDQCARHSSLWPLCWVTPWHCQRPAQRDRCQKKNSFWPMLPTPVLWTSFLIEWIERSQMIPGGKLHNDDPFFHLIQKCLC